MMRIATILFFVFAALSLIFCIALYAGVFNVGHAAIPAIAMYTCAPAAVVFIAILIVSAFTIPKAPAPNTVRCYYLSISLNILINLVASFPLYRAL